MRGPGFTGGTGLLVRLRVQGSQVLGVEGRVVSWGLGLRFAAVLQT